MCFAQNDDVIQALAANAAEVSFADGVQIWTTRRNADDFYARTLGDGSEMAAKFTVIVANQETWTFPKRCRFTQLLRRPHITW